MDRKPDFLEQLNKAWSIFLLVAITAIISISLF